jgi:BMFP domain-containing protein YqiC
MDVAKERVMQTENRLFDDFVKMVNGAAGTFAGMTREAEAGFRERVREWVGGMDMVSREEFEAVKAMAVAAREENQSLKARLDALEAAAPKASSRRASKEPPPDPAPL